jgi:hypothetical protein
MVHNRWAAVPRVQDPDRTDPSTQVLVVWYTLVPAATSYRDRHSMTLPLEYLALAAAPSSVKPPGMSAGVPGTFRARLRVGSRVGNRWQNLACPAAIVIQIYF